MDKSRPVRSFVLTGVLSVAIPAGLSGAIIGPPSEDPEMRLRETLQIIRDYGAAAVIAPHAQMLIAEDSKKYNKIG